VHVSLDKSTNGNIEITYLGGGTHLYITKLLITTWASAFITTLMVHRGKLNNGNEKLLVSFYSKIVSTNLLHQGLVDGDRGK